MLIDAGDMLDGERLVYRSELIARLGVTYVTVWNWMRDGKFPRGRKIAGKVAWLRSEVDTFLATLPAQKLKGDPGYRERRA